MDASLASSLSRAELPASDLSVGLRARPSFFSVANGTSEIA